VQLIALAIAAASADERVLVTGHLYTDSVGTLVVSPIARVESDLTDEVSISGRFLVNRVTAASRTIDGVSAASPENRGMGGVSLLRERNAGRVSGLFERSVEADYRSTTVGAGVSQDFAARCTTVDLYWWHGFDEISPNLTGQPEEVYDKNTDSLRLTLTQVIGRGTLMSATYDVTNVRGYQQNAYYSDVISYAEGAVITLEDSAPDRRTRHAVAARMAQWLPTRGALHPRVRLYADDWGVRSITGDLSYAQHIRESMIFTLRYRRYQQTAAWFYSDTYTTADLASEHSLDTKLDALDSQLGGVGISLDLEALRKALRAERLVSLSTYGSYDRYFQRHDDWTFVANMGQLGLATVF